MASDAELQDWVSDKLHENMGMSDKHAVAYLVSLAKKTNSVSKYISTLSDVLGDDHNFNEVARELWNKVPRKDKGENANRIKEQIALEQQQKNMNYKMLSDSEEELAPIVKPSKLKEKKAKKKKKKNIRKRRTESSESEGEEVKLKDKNDYSDSDNEETERLKDLQERDEFAKRLKKKDKEQTRNLMEKSDKKSFENAKKRLQIESEDRRKVVPELRDRARKDYVKKRKVEKVEALREDIEDDEDMFEESELTERERLERDYKKKVCFLFILFVIYPYFKFTLYI